MIEPNYSLDKIEFIGRESILKDIRLWLQDGNFHIAFFSGDYGVGKTRVLQKALDIAREELNYNGAPGHLIDLYHFRHHSPEGLARAIYASFKGGKSESYFYPFIAAQGKLDAARAAGNSAAIRKHLQEMLNLCGECLAKLSAEQGVLLLFDTVERFVYPAGKRFAPAWEWLAGWLGGLKRGAVLFAGRAEAASLFTQISCPPTPLGFFSPEESRAYLLATAKYFSEEKGVQVEFAEDDIQRLHTLSKGRPILLTLFLEIRLRDPQAFRELGAIADESFEAAVVDHLLSQPELGETLKAAGRAHKGINAELLSKIRRIPLRDAQSALGAIRELSIVKQFPGDDRLFLHDEMYKLFDKYVYGDVSDAAEGGIAAQAIYEYYSKAIENQNAKLRDVFSDITHKADQNLPPTESEEIVKKIRQFEETRQGLKSEFLYYRLRHPVGKEGKRQAHEDDPIFAGLKLFYRFGHEAATSANDEVLIPLQIELTNFWLSCDEKNPWKPFMEGLLPLHEIWLNVATGQNYQEGIPALQKHLDGIAGLPAEQKNILRALLETWSATWLVFSKSHDYDRAEDMFTRAIAELRKVSAAENLDWFKNMALSLTVRQRAYLRYSRGDYQNAIKDYQGGLRNVRAAGFYHEEATLRNDLGLAQDYIGKFRSAVENISDGLQLRYRVATGPRIALSHSSLAQHHIFTGAFEDGRKHAVYALRISDAVGFQRGKAFGNLMLAETARRFAFASFGPSNRPESLEQARKAIEIAAHLFEELGENAMLIEARLEYACYYRDMVRVENDPANKKNWFEMADKKLREVEDMARQAGIEHRAVDAISNRVWLGYYADKPDYAEQAFQEFKQLETLKPYWLANGKVADPQKANANPILLTRIAKCYIGRGMVALRKWRSTGAPALLAETARHFTLGMAYNGIQWKDHRGIREARRGVYTSLTALHDDELRNFCEYVARVEKDENLASPSTLRELMEDHALWFAD